MKKFDFWIFCESHPFDDSDILKKQFGYYIMLFVKREAKWIKETQKFIISDTINKIIKEAMETYPFEIYMDQVGVSHYYLNIIELYR